MKIALEFQFSFQIIVLYYRHYVLDAGTKECIYSSAEQTWMKNVEEFFFQGC